MTTEPLARSCAGHKAVTPEDAARVWIQWCHDCGWTPARASECVSLAGALGRQTAEPVRALIDVPAHAVSAMDGVAVAVADATSDIDGQMAWARGRWSVVDTGDLLPVSTDAVIRSEDLSVVNGAVLTRRRIAVGDDVRVRGEDMSCGEVILPARHRIRPVDLASVCGAGVEALPVLIRPVVAVIPTGDEIRATGVPLNAGEIRDTNSVMLAGLLEQLGARPLLCAVVPDDPALLRTAVQDAAVRADMILLIAGTSAGRDDHAADVLTTLGSLAFSQLAIRPGHPTMAGVITGDKPTPVIGLPGYPIAALDAFDLLARPLLEAPPAETGSVRARLAGPLASTPGVRDTRRVRLNAIGGPHTLPVAVPLPRGAAATTTLVAAEGLVRIPPGRGAHQTGDVVTVELVAGAVAQGRTINIWGPSASNAARTVEQEARQRFPRGVVSWTDASSEEALAALLDGLSHAALMVVGAGALPPAMPAPFRSTTIATDGIVTELLLTRADTDLLELFPESGVAQCVTQ